jgi:hypothetical protein
LPPTGAARELADVAIAQSLLLLLLLLLLSLVLSEPRLATATAPSGPGATLSNLLGNRRWLNGKPDAPRAPAAACAQWS